jgi:hypothetical protein
MNWKRGLFRLWTFVTLVWVAASSWQLWDYLTNDCDSIARRNFSDGVECTIQSAAMFGLENIATIFDDDRWPPWRPTLTEVYAAKWILVPPVGLLIFGYLGFWVGRGFQRPPSK